MNETNDTQQAAPPREPTPRMMQVGFAMRNAGETDITRIWMAMYDAWYASLPTADQQTPLRDEASAPTTKATHTAESYPEDVERWARHCEAAIERATLAAKVGGRTSETREEADRVSQGARDAENEAQEAVRAAIRYAWYSASIAAVWRAPDAAQACISALRCVAELESGHLPEPVFRAVDQALEMYGREERSPDGPDCARKGQCTTADCAWPDCVEFPTQQTPLPAERDERAAFEAAFRTYFGSEPQPGFDQPADFWLERIDDGRYATTRVDDAWTGWKAAIASQAGEQDQTAPPTKES